MSFKDLFVFVAGGAIGSVVTWYLVKDKYEQMANDNIREVREYYNNISEDKEEYNDILDSNGYRNYSKKEEKEEEEAVNKPYVISPEQFDDNDDYDIKSLTYYSDGVLADERGNVIENVEDTVGEDSLSHFGEFEDDSVFVRDDKNKIDYEILADTAPFSEAYFQ